MPTPARKRPAPSIELPEEHYTWAERLTAEHLQTDTDVRAALREATAMAWTDRSEIRTPAAKVENGRRVIRISVTEARSMLRASLPYLPKKHGLRRETADLTRQLHATHLALLALKVENERFHLPRAVATAAALVASLTAWIEEANWREACFVAKVRWPKRVNKDSQQAGAISINGVMAQQTFNFEEPLQNIHHLTPQRTAA